MRSPRTEVAPKPIGRFAIQALALALLLAYWPSLRELYPPLLRLQAEALYGGASGVHLRAAEPQRERVPDSVMELLAEGDPTPRWRARFDAVAMGWWPSAALLALLLATPMSARRRALGAAAGLLWIDAVALGRLGLEILRAGAEVESGAPSAPVGTGELLLLRTASEVANSNIVVIATVLLAWAAMARPSQALQRGRFAAVLGASSRGAGRHGARTS